MIPVVTPQFIRKVEKDVTEFIGISEDVLMENAGRGIASLIHKKFHLLENSKATILVGKGNNGGDGLVVARYLGKWGWNIQVLLLFSPNELSPLSKKQFESLSRLTEMDPDVLVNITLVDSPSDMWSFHPGNLIIDSILGTGSKLKNEFNPLFFSAIEWANASGSPIVAVDIPSGLDPEKGLLSNTCIQATLTCALGTIKTGYLLNSGPSVIGEIEIIDIGIPEKFLNDSLYFLNSKNSVLEYFPKRSVDLHKYSAGHVLVIAGSEGYHGAAVLASKGAMSTGAGMVSLFTHNKCKPSVDAHIIDHPVFGVEYSMNGIDDSDFWRLMEKADVLVIGPGIGRNIETIEMVRYVLSKVNKPIVVDADAIFALYEWNNFSDQIQSHWIITPHRGEFEKLVGNEIENDSILEMVSNFSVANKITIVYKGPFSIIATPDGICVFNSTGNNGLATAGTGDVLAGIIGSLISQGEYPDFAAADGVFLHGFAADMAVKELTEYSLTASKLINFLPLAIQQILSND